MAHKTTKAKKLAVKKKHTIKAVKTSKKDVQEQEIKEES